MTREGIIKNFNSDVVPLTVIYEGLKINNEKFTERFDTDRGFYEFYSKLPQVPQNMLIKLAMSNIQKRFQINEIMNIDLETIKFI